MSSIDVSAFRAFHATGFLNRWFTPPARVVSALRAYSAVLVLSPNGWHMFGRGR